MDESKPAMKAINAAETHRFLAEEIRVEAGPGELFEVGPNHDAWVSGNEPCIALDFALIPIDAQRRFTPGP